MHHAVSAEALPISVIPAARRVLAVVVPLLSHIVTGLKLASAV